MLFISYYIFFVQVLNGTTTIKTYKDRYAVVHSRSYMPLNGNLHGRLVYVNPRNACSSIDPTNATNLIAFVPNYDDCIDQNVSMHRTVYYV